MKYLFLQYFSLSFFCSKIIYLNLLHLQHLSKNQNLHPAWNNGILLLCIVEEERSSSFRLRLIFFNNSFFWPFNPLSHYSWNLATTAHPRIKIPWATLCTLCYFSAHNLNLVTPIFQLMYFGNYFLTHLFLVSVSLFIIR